MRSLIRGKRGFVLLLLVAALLLWFFGWGRDGVHDGYGLKPRTDIAGIASFVSISNLHFLGEEAADQELEATYVFPDRARWSITGEALEQGDRGSRFLLFRSADTTYSIDPGKSESVKLEGSEHEVNLLRIELRRASMIWPDGFAWQETADGWKVELPAVGRLEAERGEGERPKLIRSYDLNGELQETYRAIEWQELRARTWPRRWILKNFGEPVWEEEFLSIRTDPELLDEFFLPPDRRATEETGAPTETHKAQSLPELGVRREPLEQQAWESAFDRAEEFAGRLQKELAAQGIERTVQGGIELGLEGRIRAVYAQVLEPPEELPGVWERLPAQAAAAMEIGGADSLRLRHIVKLTDRAPQSAHLSTLRAFRDPAGGKLLLVLPFGAGH